MRKVATRQAGDGVAAARQAGDAATDRPAPPDAVPVGADRHRRRPPVGDVPPGPPGGWVGTVQRILDTLPGAVALLAPVRDADGGIVDFVVEAASPEAVDPAGRRGGQIIGLSVSRAYHADLDSDRWRAYRRVLATGVPEHVGPFPHTDTAGGTAVSTTYSARANRLGDRLLLVWVRHDEEARRAARLARTERLANLGWGEWDLLSGHVEWSEQLYRIFERDPAHGPMGRAELQALVVPEDLPAQVAAAEAFLAGEVSDVVYRAHVNGRVRHLRAVVDAVRDVDGRPVKVYGIVQDVTARETTLQRLAEVTRRLAEQQRNLDAEHRLAVHLQHIILPIPEEPIDLPGLRVAVRYLPAEHLSHVGGDWYHAAALSDGTTLLAVGDVAGHGIPAATTMAELRHALRALTVVTTEPAELLAHLNRLMCEMVEESPTATATATAVVARYDPAGRTLTWAQAGHPPPLLNRGGVTALLPRPHGPLLGVVPHAAYRSATLPFDRDDVLLLYTDGLVEQRRHTLDEGLAALVRTVDEAVAGSPDQALSTLLGRLRRANPKDDTCILAARPLTGHGEG